MFNSGDVIDGKYIVEKLCSDAGGMGAVLFVQPKGAPFPFQVVLKYCRDTEEEHLRRFKREVRLLETFAGNDRIVQIVDSNLDHSPPYFVMRYYAGGDLLQQTDRLRGSPAELEQVYLQMIAAVNELHLRGQFHRDIKPQNFLIDGERIVVSDFGLSVEVGSLTAFTRSSAWWGTHGYIPPEFMAGGFKTADAAGDIFMLGKTMYVLATGRQPMYLTADEIPAPLYRVLQKCCNLDKGERYQSLAELQQAMTSVFDVVLARGGGIGKVRQLLASIAAKLERERPHYVVDEVREFVDELALLDAAGQKVICTDLPSGLFEVISHATLHASISSFLDSYASLVESKDYGWGYAETIADSMKLVFSSPEVRAEVKAKALDLAIRAARYMHRFAAMDTCKSLITEIRDQDLALHVAAVIADHANSFVAEIEPSKCHNSAIASALLALKP